MINFSIGKKPYRYVFLYGMFFVEHALPIKPEHAAKLTGSSTPDNNWFDYPRDEIGDYWLHGYYANSARFVYVPLEEYRNAIPTLKQLDEEILKAAELYQVALSACLVSPTKLDDLKDVGERYRETKSRLELLQTLLFMKQHLRPDIKVYVVEGIGDTELKELAPETAILRMVVEEMRLDILKYFHPRDY